MDRFELHIQNLLNNRKDETYEACMGSGTFHNHHKLTFSYVKCMEQGGDLSLDSSFLKDPKYSLASDFDIDRLRRIMDKYKLLDLLYLEPLHAQGACTTIEIEPEETLLNEDETHYINGFDKIKNELSSFITPLLRHDIDNGKLELEIINTRSGYKGKIVDEGLILLLKTVFIKLAEDWSSRYDVLALSKNKNIQSLNNVGEDQDNSINQEKHKNTFLGQWGKYLFQNFQEPNTNILQGREINLNELISIENIKSLKQIDIKHLGRKKTYSTAMKQLVIRLSFLLRLENFIKDKKGSIQDISISKNQYSFIYEYLRVYNLIKDDESMSTEGHELVRSIIQEVRKKNESWYKENLERVNSFVLDHAR